MEPLPRSSPRRLRLFRRRLRVLRTANGTRIVSPSRNSKRRSMRAPHYRLSTPTFQPLTATSLAQRRKGKCSARFSPITHPGLVPFAAASRSRLWPKPFLLVLLSSLSRLLPLWRRRRRPLRPIRLLVINTRRSQLPPCQLPPRRLLLRRLLLRRLPPRRRLRLRSWVASSVGAPPTTR